MCGRLSGQVIVAAEGRILSGKNIITKECVFK